jgi:hypothetical protein
MRCQALSLLLRINGGSQRLGQAVADASCSQKEYLVQDNPPDHHETACDYYHTHIQKCYAVKGLVGHRTP